MDKINAYISGLPTIVQILFVLGLVFSAGFGVAAYFDAPWWVRIISGIAALLFFSYLLDDSQSPSGN